MLRSRKSQKGSTVSKSGPRRDHRAKVEHLTQPSSPVLFLSMVTSVMQLPSNSGHPWSFGVSSPQESYD